MRGLVPLTLLAGVVLGSSYALADTPKDPTMARADADMRGVLEQLAALGPKPIETLSPAEARRQPTAADAVIQLNQTKGTLVVEKLPAVGKVASRSIPGPDGTPLTLRVYTPPGDGPFPVIVYYHGGGWVIASLDTYDGSARALATMAKAVVVAVDYRRAPENPFPAAPEDAYAAFQYVATHAADFGGKPDKIAVAGESAGGNLATVVCLMAKERKGAMPVHQALIYPVTNYAFDTKSYADNAQAKPLDLPMMKWFFKNYLKDEKDGANVLVSPLRATPEQLRGLPPASVLTVEIDPLRDDGRGYAAKLKAAGVPVKTLDLPGLTHEAFGMGLVVGKAKQAETFIADGLGESFGK